MTFSCPECWIEFTTEPEYITHRFNEIADWFTNTGEHDNANRYATKDPNDYQVVDGIIQRKDQQ